MLNRRIVLSGLWVTVVLLYLIGDVLRIYSGDWARMADAQDPGNLKWLAAAVFMLIPILMVSLTLILPQPISRWANIIVAIAFLVFVGVDMLSYPSAFDKFLLVVSMVFNVMTVGYAWKWTKAASA